MKVREELFRKVYEGENYEIPISDIPLELLVPENNITVQFNSEDTYLIIFRWREQTQKEKEEMYLFFKQKKLEMKEKRRNLFLKLKKEFENE